MDKWATLVVPKDAIFTDSNGKSGVNQEKAFNYTSNKYNKELVLWMSPLNSIRIEFEDTTEMCNKYITTCESQAKSMGFDYCITEHDGGKSPYFNMFNLPQPNNLMDWKSIKLVLIDMLLTDKAKNQLDRTNLGFTLTPIIEHPHWKEKYKGAVHKIIRGKNPLEHNNQNDIIKEVIKKVEKNRNKITKGIVKIRTSNEKWVEDFLINYCCNNKLPQGERHNIICKNYAIMISFRDERDSYIKSFCETQNMGTIELLGWITACLNGIYTEVNAGEIYKYIQRNKINYHIPFERIENNKEYSNECSYTSLIICDNFLVEQVYSEEEKKNKFCVYKDNNYGFVDSFEYDGILYKPICDEEIEKRVVRLPSLPLEYGSEEQLDEELKNFIKEWLDVPDEFVQFAVWNIRRSWIYERFNSLNYLRALGDTGTGKSRFLNTLGYLHYKPITVAGALTPAVLFRLIEKWKGTLMIDEFDVNKSDESNSIIKIINCGYEKFMPVSRCDTDNKNKLQFFDTYCPKIMVTRKVFDDKATESRCITAILRQTNRKNIKEVLTQTFWDKSLELRNKLLMYRFRNFHKIDPDVGLDVDLGELEPRIRQVNRSFVSMFAHDLKALERFKTFLAEYQRDLINERIESFEGIIINVLYDYIEHCKQHEEPLDFSISDLITFGGDKFYPDTKPRQISKKLKSLGFKELIYKKVNGVAKKCVPLDDQELLIYLFKRYILGNRATVETDTKRMVNFSFQHDKQPESQQKLDGNPHHRVSFDGFPVSETKQPFLRNLTEFTKCEVPGCGKYECNRDGKNRAYCPQHWETHADQPEKPQNQVPQETNVEEEII